MDEPTITRVGVRELRGKLSGYLRQARQGASFLVVSHGEVVAELRPAGSPARADRQPGRLRGQIRMAPDFDTLPPDLLADMTGEDSAGTPG